MTLEHTESEAALAEKNRRLQALVAELLKKNEGLRQQLSSLQRPSGDSSLRARSS